MKMASMIILNVLLIISLSSCGTMDNKTVSDIAIMETVSTIQEQGTDNISDTHVQEEGTEEMKNYDFSVFNNVEITGIDVDLLGSEEQSVLYRQAEYCQAMTDADIETMREIVSEEMTFTHMSGMTQSREEYFADVADGSLNYFTIGIEGPVIKVTGDTATITYTAVLNANAYGARGTYRIKGTHHYEKHDGVWTAVNS